MLISSTSILNFNQRMHSPNNLVENLSSDIEMYCLDSLHRQNQLSTQSQYNISTITSVLLMKSTISFIVIPTGQMVVLNRVCFSEYKSHTINHVDVFRRFHTSFFFSIGSRSREAGALSLGKSDTDLKGRIRNNKSTSVSSLACSAY